MNVKRAILTTLRAVGVLTVALLAPKALQAFANLGLIDSSYDRGRYMRTVVRRLQRQGFIEFKKEKGITYARITKKGEAELRGYRFDEYRDSYEQPKKWDKKWRVVIFDVKEQYREARKQLRDELTRWGFVKLQDSVWVYPYPCEEYITLLKTNFELGKSVLYMIVEEIENDTWLRNEFGLEN